MGNLSRKQRLIDRGLPDSYDPHYFYEYRIATRSKEATGIEGLVYKLIPWELIRSFAFAIDPLSPFKVAPGKISQVNRTRKRTLASVLDQRKEVVRYRLTSGGAIKNYQNRPGHYGPIVYDPPVQTDTTYLHGKQEPLPWTSKDTTSRTRPLGSSQGEFQKLKSSVASSSFSSQTRSELTQLATIQPGQDYPDFAQSIVSRQYQISPSAAVYRLSDYNSVSSQEMDFLTALMQKEALSMYKGINPQHRNFSLFRNIVELRDIPRGILQLQDTIRNLRNLESSFNPTTFNGLRHLLNSVGTSIKDVPKEYLSYHFGWKQTYSDIVGLLTKPERISSQIDLLIRRSGKPTTYRSKKSFISGRSDAPGFLYDTVGAGELSRATTLQRVVTLDMVVNTTFDFPDVNSPKFRSDLFATKLGIYPRATDIYNLVPWTWLVDWFTGLGNYIEIIDEINHDKSLINWGFITGNSSVDITTNVIAQNESRVNISVNGVGPGDILTKNRYNHSSTLHLDLQLRKNVASIFDVKTTSDPSSLTPYQNSILGALLSQRTNFRR